MKNSLTSMVKILDKAYKGGYAVGAFNFSSIEVMRAIVDAANNKKSPVILALSESGLRYATPSYLTHVIKAALEESKVPIALHLDHGKDLAIIKEVIKYGFNSVMIDGSFLPFEENIKLTKKVVEYADEYGVAVEGELGVLAGVEDDVKHETGHYTNPEQAAEFVEKTGVDSLAIAIGTSHGAFKFKGEAELRFDILKDIEKLIPGFPIVLHGASNVPEFVVEKINQYGGNVAGAKGVPEEIVKKACAMAVCKVNMDTDLRMAYTAALREYFANNPAEFTPRKYLQYGKDEVRKLIEDKMEHTLMSAGKA